MNEKRKKALKKGLAVVSGLSASHLLAVLLTASVVMASFTAYNLYLDAFPHTASYTIEADGAGNYRAIRYDGKVLWDSTNASYVWNSAREGLGTLATGAPGTIYVKKGTYQVTAAWVLGKQTQMLCENGVLLNVTTNTNAIEISNVNMGAYWSIENVQIDMNLYNGHAIYSGYLGQSGVSSIPTINKVKIWDVAAGYAGIWGLSPRMLHGEQIQISTKGYGIYFGMNETYGTHDGNSDFSFVQIFLQANNSVGIHLRCGSSYVINLMEWSYVDIQTSSSYTNTTGIWFYGARSNSFHYVQMEYPSVGLRFDYGGWAGSESNGHTFYHLGISNAGTCCVDLNDGSYHNQFFGSALGCDEASDYIIDDDNALGPPTNRFYAFRMSTGTFDLTLGSVIYDSYKINSGMIGSNYGTATNCVNGTWIAHGLAGTPTNVILTVKGSMYINATTHLLEPTVIASNSTHFQISFLYWNTVSPYIYAVTSAEQRDIMWTVEYQP